MFYYQYPFKEKYTFGTPFGKRGSMWRAGYHSGLDLNSKKHGSSGDVFPIAPGVVESLNAHGSAYGRHLCIKHEDGFISLYAHLEFIKVKKGDRVDLDTVIGREGSTGNSTGNHLHIEVHKDRYKYPATIDPQKHIDERVLKVSEIKYTLPDGKALKTDGVLIDGTNYAAVRPLLEALGYKVGWDNATKTILITK